MIFICCLLFLFFLSSAEAEVYFMLPNNLEIENVNKGIKTKTKNRYTNADQIENQYKGKLKYKPSNNMIKNDRKGRYYTSVGYLINRKITIDEINNKSDDTIYSGENSSKFKDSFSAEAGLYFTNSFALGIEFYELKNSSVKFDDIKVEMTNQVYMLNAFFENNYSKIVPFFGAGIGIARNKFSENFGLSSIYYANKDKGGVIPVYQFYIGTDYMYDERSMIFIKYKYFNTIKDIKLTRTYRNTTSEYLISLDDKSSFIIGFKYLW